jgi:hypothetical protein
MNKKVLTFIVVILCVLLFGGGYFAYQFVKNDVQSTSNTPSNRLVEKDDKEGEKQGPAPSDEDAQRIAEKTYTAFFEKLYDTAEDNDWYGNEVDYKVLEEELSPYVTQRFFEYIQALPQEDLFCQCDSFVFESPEFDARNIVVESTSDYMKMRTVHFGNYLSEGSQVFLEFKKDRDGKWKVDHYSEISAEDKPLNLTAEEAKAGYKDHFKKMEYIKETYIDERDELAKVYLFHVVGDAQDYITAVYASSGFEKQDIPLEIVPLKWRDKVLDSDF